MDQANALPTPMVSNLSFSSKQGTPISNPQEYWSIVVPYHMLLISDLTLCLV